jgi:hypothetical protein
MRRRLIRLGAVTRHCDMCGWEQMHEHQLSGSRMHAD